MTDPTTLVDFATWFQHSTFTDPHEAAEWWLENVYLSPADKLQASRQYNRVGFAGDKLMNSRISCDVLFKAMSHPDGQYIICSWVPGSPEDSFTDMGASAHIDRLPLVIARYATDMNQQAAADKFTRILNAISVTAKSFIYKTILNRAKNN